VFEKIKSVFAVLGAIIVSIAAFILGRKSKGADNTDSRGGAGSLDRGVSQKLEEAGRDNQRITDEQRELGNQIDVSRGIVGDNEILLNEAKRIAERNAEIARKLSGRS
jgi:hypothetical protein